MIFTTEGFLEVAIESWPEWNWTATFAQLLHFHLIVQCSCFISAISIISRHICFKQNLAQVIMLGVEWIDTYGINNWRIFRSSYRKLIWVGFKPTTTEFQSDALTDWAIRPWVQHALRASFAQLLQFCLIVQYSHFISIIAFVILHICLKQNLYKYIYLSIYLSIYLYIYIYIYIYEICKTRLYQITKYANFFTFYLCLFKLSKPNASCSQLHSI